jgi:uncharacterized metal-binding protein YceD (DUF177 family)
VSSLEIPISTVTDVGLHVDVTVPAADLCPADTPDLPLREVVVSGDFTPLVGQILFQGTVKAVFTNTCDRCLKEAVIPVTSSVVWTFEEGSPENNAGDAGADLEVEEEAHGVFTFDGIAIDLARPVWDEAVLALPAKFVCREDCRGLCPVCGANRNEEPCACEDAPTEETPAGNSGFAGLKDMFPDLPEQR